MSGFSLGPASSIDTLKRYVKNIEEGKLDKWIFIYPLHGIKLKRWVIDNFEREIDYNIGFICPDGLTSDDLRFIAFKLNQRADFTDSLPNPIE